MNIVEQECMAPGWAQIRARGRRDFILRYGVRGWALPVGVAVWLAAFVVVPVLMMEPSPDWAYLGSRPFVLSVLAGVGLWPLGGWAWAAWEWRRCEARFAGEGGRRA